MGKLAGGFARTHGLITEAESLNKVAVVVKPRSLEDNVTHAATLVEGKRRSQGK